MCGQVHIDPVIITFITNDFRMGIMLLFYILQNNYLVTSCIFFQDTADCYTSYQVTLVSLAHLTALWHINESLDSTYVGY
jgi:hypothetical protein